MNDLKFFEVECRAVAVDVANSRAWAFNPGLGWGEAPGLVNKASLDGVPLTLAEMADEFPEADPKFLPVTPPR
ncbi:hypothetical protein [Croceicoccus sp. BE223]|uniref:hypothetical protein n=1 Tax=Croceicoccus sp. BE223 TaxID=2817716 RepID=UPI002867114E|nr:hypothetical protein [Croceicoccus sp. BE223]MDR7102971.1 hypothetical protein [Croceicoccus sp. BE223]